MATIGTLLINVIAKTAGFRKGLNKANRRMKLFSTGMKKVFGGLKRLGFVAAAAAVAVFTMALRSTIKTFVEFEAGMAEVRSILLDVSDRVFAKLTKVARHLGATTRFTAVEAAKAMSFMARAGFEVNEVMAASPHVLDLASAAGMELAETADIVSQVIRGMGLEATEAQRVTDVLGLTAARTNTSVSQLGQAFGYVAPVAHALGITLEQTAAMLGMLSNAGIQADRAGTGLKNIFAELAAEIDENGISALEKFTKGGISVAEAFDIFQKRGGPAILALESMAMRTDELIAVLQLAEGTIKRMNDIRMDTIEGAWKLVKSAVSDLQIEIAEKLEPTIRNVEESLRELAVAATLVVGNFAESMDGSIVSVQQLNEAIISLIKGVRVVANVVIRAAGAVMIVWTTVSAVIVTVFIAALEIVAGVMLAISDILGIFWGDAKTLANDLDRLMVSLAKEVGRQWESVADAVKQTFGSSEFVMGLQVVERALAEQLRLQQEIYEVTQANNKLMVDPVRLSEAIIKSDQKRNDLLTERQRLQRAEGSVRLLAFQFDDPSVIDAWSLKLKAVKEEIVRVTLEGKDLREKLEALDARWQLQIEVARKGWEVGDPEALKGVKAELEKELEAHQKSQGAIDRGTQQWGAYQQEINRVQGAIQQLTVNIDALKGAEDAFFNANKRIGETKAQFQERMNWIEEQRVALVEWTKDQHDEIDKLNAALLGLPVEIYLGDIAHLTSASIANAKALAAEVKELEDKNKRMTDGQALIEKHTSATDKYTAAEARLNKMLAEGFIDDRTRLLELGELAKARDAALGIGKPDMGKAIEGIQSAFGTVKMKAQFGGGAQSVATKQLNTATQQLSSLKSIATNTGTMASTTGANSLGMQLAGAMNDVTFTIIGMDKQEELLREGNETRDSSLSELKKINAGVAAMSSSGVLQ